MKKLCTALLIFAVVLLIHLNMKKQEECEKKSNEKFYANIPNDLAKNLGNYSVNSYNAGYSNKQLTDY